MRKLLWLLLLIVPCAARAQCGIPSGSSIATIQSAITTAASNSCGGSIHNEALFAAGTSNVAWASGGSQINIPCPTSSGLIITGPTTTYDQPGVLNAWASRPTATIRNTSSGESYQLFSWPGGCTNPITITYLEVDGNRPASGGGALYVNYSGGGPSAATSNGTIEYNWFHGNQSQAQTVCGTNCVNGGQDFAANEIYFDGFNGAASNSGTYHTNFTIDHNIFGAGSTANPTAGDCGNIMQWVGVCTNTSTGDGCNFVGYDTIGGQCAALGVHTNTTNFHFDYNKIIQEEQGTKWYEGGSPFNGDGAYSLFFQTNDTMNNNDIGTYHRIGTEDQQSSQTYSPLQGTCSLDAEGDCMTHRNNDMHDNYVPSFGNWGFSLANTGFRDDSNNLMISNDSASNGTAGPGDFEDFSTYFGVNNNFSQGYVACSVQFGGNNTIEANSSVSNNIFQNPNGSYPNNCSIQFSINNSHGGVPATASNNSGTTACCTPIQSVAPSMSPNGGTFSGSVAVTLTDNGNTSGQGPQGNTGIWCTQDGSTPVPKTGTAIYYPTGYVLTLTTSTTMKCLGMWGAQNQPAPAGTSTSDITYPSGGFGYTASPVISAFFQLSGSSTPTLTGISLSLAGNTLTVGQSAQVTATCTYSNGTSDTCNTTDAFGNAANTWTSSNTTTATINSTGTLTGLAAGSTNVQAKAGSFTATAIPITITAAAPTLTGVTIADGGVGTVSVGQTAQATATAVYNSGSITTSCSATADAYGTTCGTWTSSAAANASISNSGLITGVAVGTAGMTVKATNGSTSSTSSPLSITVTSPTPPAATLTGVTVSCSSSNITVGNTTSCAATCSYSDGTTTNCTSTDPHGNSVAGSWTSSVTGVATINASTGVVTGVAGGLANISATSGTHAAPAFALTVTPTITGNILGQNLYDFAGVTYPNALVATYAISPATVSNVSYLNFYLASGTALVAGNKYDVILTLAPTATTQSAATLCTATYTTLGTTADYGWHQIAPNGSGCGSLPATTGYWIGTVTNAAGPAGLGFYDCAGGTAGCTGGAPTTPGPGTYHFWIASVNYGVYTNMPAAMINPLQSGQTGYQASAYATLTTPTATLIGGYLTIPGGTPAPGSVLNTGQTIQFTAFCSYSDGTSYACSAAPDKYGNTVLSWASSNTGAVTIGAVSSTTPGLATAVGSGTASITAVLGGGANAMVVVEMEGAYGQ